MSTRHVWVTGGAGFLGQAVVKRLIAAGNFVHCLVRSGQASRELSSSVPPSDRSRLDIVSGSLNDLEACRQLVATAPAGLHIASSLSGSAAALFSANVVATRTLLRAVKEHSCERFVLVSSIAVYGTSHLKSGDVLDERVPLDPNPHQRDPYTFSKVAQERVCWDARAEWGLPLVVARPGMIYGPGRECLSARVGIKVGPILVRMGGYQRLPYTYVDNCADALVLAVTLPAIDGESFNLIDDELPTGAQLIREQRKRVGPVRTIAVPLWALARLARVYTAYSNYSKGQLPPILTPYRVNASWNSVRYSNDKARKRLAWDCNVSLEDGLAATLESLKARRSY